MRRISTMVAVAVFAALISANCLAQTPSPPKAVPEAPAMGGEPQTKPGPAVISLRANEVALSRLANASLLRTKTEKLGQLSTTLYPDSANTTANVPQRVGTVISAALDLKQKKITAVGVKTGNDDDKISALPWSQIHAIHQPNDEFQTSMTAQAIAAAPAFPHDAKSGAIDVDRAFIGRNVKTTDGKTIGTVSDVIAQSGSGTLDYIVVQPSGLSLGTSNGPYAVSWAKLKPISEDKSQPIALALNSNQLATLPVFGGSKAQETPGTRAAGTQAGAKEPPP